TGQFRRLLAGGAKLTKFSFRFEPPSATASSWQSPALDFDVEPDSSPPTNVHALIGRNGVGKSHMLHLMARSLVRHSRTGAAGRFISQTAGETEEPLFAGV